MKYKIYNQDVMEWANEYQKGKFHALFCDAPYHLTSIVKRYKKVDTSKNTVTNDITLGRKNQFGRLTKGFMNQSWDGGDIAFRPETWAALGEHLYPGAFGMAFSASRNWHRMAVAIEDAGFIIHPTIFGWLNGQGFPKATNISKQLDKGKEGEVVGKKKLWGHNAGSGAGSFSKNKYEGHTGEIRYEDIHAPASELSATWQGHRYGLQALKPAVEPIIVFQKPFEGKPLDNIVSTGAGALNIDGGRIPTQDEYVINQFDDGMKPFGNGAGHKYTSRKISVPQSNPKNRKGVVGTDLGISNADIEKFQQSQRDSIEALETKGRWPANFILDESVAGKLESSRFFFNVQEQIDKADPIYYCGKVSPKERNAGLGEEFPIVRTGAIEARNRESMKGQFEGPTPMGRNPHPTLKPIALAKYLATLLLPPEAYAPRRILVPFSGVGSELIGCALAGWEHIVGIEFDTENGYVEIAHKRMEHWTK